MGSGFEVDGLRLVGRGLCMRVWGWRVQSWFVHAGMELAQLDPYVGPASNLCGPKLAYLGAMLAHLGAMLVGFGVGGLGLVGRGV